MASLKVVNIIYTYRCNARCRHCQYGCSATRTEKMTLDFAKDSVLEAFCVGTGWINIMGGEPFMYYDEIADLIAFISSLGMRCSIITNAFWATTPKKSKKMLLVLKTNGLAMVGISTDDFHGEYVEWRRVNNAIKAARSIGLPFTVSVIRNADGSVSKVLEKRLSKLKVKPRVYPLEPLGRGGDISRRIPGSIWNGKCKCQPMLSVSPTGEVIFCCNYPPEMGRRNPLFLGYIKEKGLKRILAEVARDDVLKMISMHGPKWLYRCLYNDHRYKIGPIEKYRTTCELCADLLKIPGIRRYDFKAYFGKRRLAMHSKEPLSGVNLKR
jgi:organic radical activating enzyme